MPASTQPAPSPPTFSLAGFQGLSTYITAELGIKMSDAKRPMLQSRLQRRLLALGLPSLEAYHDYLLHSEHAETERIHFFDAVTTNKTDFFREPRHFDYLTRVALPALDPGPAASPRPWTLRLWCAGCSSGEETYTLAITLAEHAARRPGFDFEIFATDISLRVLEHAHRAIYDEERIAPMAAPLRSKYLLRSRDSSRREVRVTPALRAKVRFQRLNFMDADYGLRTRFDVIFFRNVMIYFDKPTQEAVVRKLCRHLEPGGYLFTGHSESLTGLDVPVQPVDSSVYRSRTDPDN